MKTVAFLLTSILTSSYGFTTTPPSSTSTSSSSSNLSKPTFTTTTCPSTTTTTLQMANDADLLRTSRAARSAGLEDRVVELRRPLGIVLKEDDDGNVFVEQVAPKGNAARTGMVKEGDIVTMCSATFGDDMWSTRGVGLTRVLAAIRVRAGPTVKLVFESTKETSKKSMFNKKALAAAEEARVRAQAKKDQLLKELDETDKQLKKGKFLGLF